MSKYSHGTIEEAIMKALEEYSNDVGEKVERAIKICAKGARDDLRRVSPKMTGKYASGWAIKSLTSTRQSSFSGGTDRVGSAARSGAYVGGALIHQPKKYRITHTLENGHDGPKLTSPKTPPHPHIANVAEKWSKKFEEMCEEAVKG